MFVADLEEILQGGSEEIDDHDIIVALFAGVHDPGNAWATHEGLVNLGFLAKGGCEGTWNGWLEFDSDFFPSYGVHAEENGACKMDETTNARCTDQVRTAATVCDLLLESVLAAERDVHRNRLVAEDDKPHFDLVKVFWFGLCNLPH